MKKLFFFALFLGACASALHATELPVMTDDAVQAYQRCATTNKEITEILNEQDRIYKTLHQKWMYHNYNPFTWLRECNVPEDKEKIPTQLQTYLHKIPIEKLKALLDIKDTLRRTVLRYEKECEQALEISRTHMKSYGKIRADQTAKYQEASDKRACARARYDRLVQYTTNGVIGIAAIGVVGLGAYFAHDALQKSNLSLNDLSTMATTGLNDFYTQCTRTLQQNWLFKDSASFFVVNTEK